MKRIHPRPGARIVAAGALVAALTGCGVSTSTVSKAVPSSIQTAGPTTTAPTSTEPPATEAPTTSLDLPDSTEAPDTTAPADGSGTDTLPPEARAAFMSECQTGGQSAATCGCVWDAISGELDINTLMQAGTSGSLPADLEQKIIQAEMGCISGPTS